MIFWLEIDPFLISTPCQTQFLKALSVPFYPKIFCQAASFKKTG